jgi:phosphohistidine phosphatase
MELYLVRHGIALDVGQEGITRDSDRPLSREGRQRTTEVAAGLKTIGVRPDTIAASPLVRAQETARILADGLRPDASFEICDALQPGADPVELIAWLRRGSARTVLAVGHIPDLVELTSVLLSGKTGSDFVFRKTTVCCVVFEHEVAAGRGSLAWLMQPDQLRALHHS